MDLVLELNLLNNTNNMDDLHLMKMLDTTGADDQLEHGLCNSIRHIVD